MKKNPATVKEKFIANVQKTPISFEPTEHHLVGTLKTAKAKTPKCANMPEKRHTDALIKASPTESKGFPTNYKHGWFLKFKSAASIIHGLLTTKSATGVRSLTYKEDDTFIL